MWEETIKNARILIVDDQEPNVLYLETILRKSGYKAFHSTRDPRQVLPLFIENKPDLILLDLMMPHLDGFAVMEQLKPLIPPDSYLPILVLTADISPETRRRALSSGASDFLVKPFDPTEVSLRIRNLLSAWFLHVLPQQQMVLLEEKVRERTKELEASQLEVLERLAQAAEFRDDDTGQHTQRVGRMAALLAEALGLSPDQIEIIRQAAPLHDVGKIGISDTILLKPGKLTDTEFDTIKSHAAIGARLLSHGHSSFVNIAEIIALSHHERWDGRGYPQGLKEEEIPLEGRIVAIADVFDALTHERPYKKAWPIEEALAEIERQSGKQFDPRVVEAFLQVCKCLVQADQP
jgi:putative two-component system response regulator